MGMGSVKEIVSTQQRMKENINSTAPTLSTNRAWPVLPLVLIAGLVGAACWREHSPPEGRPPGDAVASLIQLLRSPADKFPSITITRANLLCAGQLSPQNPPDVLAAEALVRTWAQHVQAETDRHWYRYQQSPTEYENSPGFFRMLMLAVVLAEDYGIQYDPARKGAPGTAQAHDGFFSDPDPSFSPDSWVPSERAPAAPCRFSMWP